MSKVKLNHDFQIDAAAPDSREQAALELVLLFYAQDFNDNVRHAWLARFYKIFRDGRSSDVTTRNLCDCIRKVLAEQPVVTQKEQV